MPVEVVFTICYGVHWCVEKQRYGDGDGTQTFVKVRRPVMENAEQTSEYADVGYAGHKGGDFLFVRKK